MNVCSFWWHHVIHAKLDIRDIYEKKTKTDKSLTVTEMNLILYKKYHYLVYKASFRIKIYTIHAENVSIAWHF